MDIEIRLRRVEAVEQIRSLKTRYCDLCDQGYPADELTELFTEDGAWDGREMGVFEGRDAIHKFFTNMPNVMSFAIHHVTNSSVEVSEDIKTATGRWYLLQTATLKASNEAVWLAARYHDQMVFKDDKWLFQRVNLISRFYASYEAGWARSPHLLEQEK